MGAPAEDPGCAVVAADKVLDANDGVPQIILATAHPAKFPDTLEKITGSRPALPPRLSKLMTDRETFTVVPAELHAIEAFVEGVARGHATVPAQKAGA